jgi:predicted lipoprotein
MSRSGLSSLKRRLLPFLAFLLCAFALYNAVYFERLDLKIQRETTRSFNPNEAVDLFWKTSLSDILKTAIDLRSFDSLLVANRSFLVHQYGKTVGISSEYSFLVHGTARTGQRNPEGIPVSIKNGNATYNLRIQHIFGNSARDALGYFRLDDFDNTMDFNAVAAALNSLIVKEVVAGTFNHVRQGAAVRFVGALTIDAEHRTQQLDIIPLHIEIIDEQQ